MVAFATMALGAYGVVLFMGVPLAAGFATGWIANSRGAVGLGGTVVLSIVSLALIAALLLLAAIEGIVCIVMVGALSVPIAIFGVILGRVVARPDWHRGTALPAIALIPLMVVETRIAEPAEFEVTSVVEVDAPPDRVWPNVIGFSELPAPDHWLFKTGIAYPLRARRRGRCGGGAPLRVLDRCVCRADYGLGAAPSTGVRRDAIATLDAGVEFLRKARTAASRTRFPIGARGVPPRAAARRPHTARRLDLVRARHGARGLLADRLRLDRAAHPPPCP